MDNGKQADRRAPAGDAPGGRRCVAHASLGLRGLDETTTVHWHGLVLPAEVDGGPHQPIAPSATWEPSFTMANPASTCWFHPHAHGSTGRQVVSGLTGVLIVDDGSVAPTALPDTWGVDDLVLVLQDKRFTAGGRIDFTLSANDQLAGYAGDRLLVNGMFGPTWRTGAFDVPLSQPRARGRGHDGTVRRGLSEHPGSSRALSAPGKADQQPEAA